MIKINTMEDLNNNIHKLPTHVLEDIEKRISDWMSTGGNNDDPYIKQQFRYAENVINAGEKGGK